MNDLILKRDLCQYSPSVDLSSSEISANNLFKLNLNCMPTVTTTHVRFTHQPSHVCLSTVRWTTSAPLSPFNRLHMHRQSVSLVSLALQPFWQQIKRAATNLWCLAISLSLEIKDFFYSAYFSLCSRFAMALALHFKRVLPQSGSNKLNWRRRLVNCSTVCTDCFRMFPKARARSDFVAMKGRALFL